jgi:hypothetical protein
MLENQYIDMARSTSMTGNVMCKFDRLLKEVGQGTRMG